MDYQHGLEEVFEALEEDSELDEESAAAAAAAIAAVMGFSQFGMQPENKRNENKNKPQQRQQQSNKALDASSALSSSQPQHQHQPHSSLPRKPPPSSAFETPHSPYYTPGTKRKYTPGSPEQRSVMAAVAGTGAVGEGDVAKDGRQGGVGDEAEQLSPGLKGVRLGKKARVRKDDNQDEENGGDGDGDHVEGNYGEERVSEPNTPPATTISTTTDIYNAKGVREYHAPNGAILTPRELWYLSCGVRQPNGDRVYFRPEFIEDDPWEGLRLGAGIAAGKGPEYGG
ncbi:hypothetical protein FQN50_001082 [Emmonsiellopsis sp. PD_5]|nr:hypothetical protein FQN50_001082 [Emmonsiellopsis sp. PD_5]